MGFDPAHLNSYQRVLVRAEMDAQARKQLDWLRYVPDKVVKPHSAVEAAAWSRIERKAREHVRPVEPEPEPGANWADAGWVLLTEVLHDMRMEYQQNERNKPCFRYAVK